MKFIENKPKDKVSKEYFKLRYRTERYLSFYTENKEKQVLTLENYISKFGELMVKVKKRLTNTIEKIVLGEYSIGLKEDIQKKMLKRRLVGLRKRVLCSVRKGI